MQWTERSDIVASLAEARDWHRVGVAMAFTSQRERWLWRGAVVLFALSLLILPLSLAVRFTAQSGWWWERGFDQYNAEARTDLSRAELDRAAAELRAYFRSNDELVDITVMNSAGVAEPLLSEREILHLRDVKRLFDRTYDAGWGSLGAIVTIIVGAIIWRGRAAGRALAAAGRLAGGAALAVVVVLGIIAVSGFDGAFRQFHLIFFTNDLWQLSSRDRLIQMFPQDFFFESTLLIGASIIGTAVVVGLVSWGVLRWSIRVDAGSGTGRLDAA